MCLPLSARAQGVPCLKAFHRLGQEQVRQGGEVQSFELRPINAGTAVLTFRNESTDTTYTYEVEVDVDKNEITVKSSKGMSGGSETEAPQPAIEKE